MAMSGHEDVVPYLRLMLNVQHPGLEECWIEGYQSAQDEIDEEDNPYQSCTREHEHWLQGWWEGFYGPEASTGIVNYPLHDKHGHQVQPKLKKNAVLRFTSRVGNNIRKNTNRLIKISSVIAAMFLVSYQLYDFII